MRRLAKVVECRASQPGVPPGPSSARPAAREEQPGPHALDRQGNHGRHPRRRDPAPAAPATDRLFEMPAPSAWIAVQAGGPNALVDRLMRESHMPGLLLDTDAPADDPRASAPAV